MKIKVLTTDDREVMLDLTEEAYAGLELEFTGQKTYLQEYKTTDGEIITDLEIERIIRDDKDEKIVN